VPFWYEGIMERLCWNKMPLFESKIVYATFKLLVVYMKVGVNMKKILVLSNDQSLKYLIDVTMRYSGLAVNFTNTSKQAWKFLEEVFFDLIMIDYELKTESGLAFYKSIRQFEKNIPILMVGQGEHDEFILKDLSLDSYDYILRPFKFKELKTKINLLLNNQEILNSPVRRDKLIIDLKNGIVNIKDQIIQLTRTELRLLMLLSKKDNTNIQRRY
jgi:DNA-binding response OmpR family regulator